MRFQEGTRRSKTLDPESIWGSEHGLTPCLCQEAFPRISVTLSGQGAGDAWMFSSAGEFQLKG